MKQGYHEKLDAPVKNAGPRFLKKSVNTSSDCFKLPKALLPNPGRDSSPSEDNLRSTRYSTVRQPFLGQITVRDILRRTASHNSGSFKPQKTTGVDQSTDKLNMYETFDWNLTSTDFNFQKNQLDKSKSQSSNFKVKNRSYLRIKDLATSQKTLERATVPTVFSLITDLDQEEKIKQRLKKNRKTEPLKPICTYLLNNSIRSTTYSEYMAANIIRTNPWLIKKSQAVIDQAKVKPLVCSRDESADACKTPGSFGSKGSAKGGYHIFRTTFE